MWAHGLIFKECEHRLPSSGHRKKHPEPTHTSDAKNLGPVHQCQIESQRQNLGEVEKAMAPHSSTLAWKIPWTEEPGRLRSMGSLGVGHD